MNNPDHYILSDKKGVVNLVLAAHHFGVEHVIISPGSRNAPLTISFSRSGLFTCHSIPDERVAGFYALGMALATGKPVAVICTSGSAGINLAPAVAEAFYLKAPLVAITADRPLSWTDQGNGQTIRQEGLFDNFINDSFSLISEPKTDDDAWYNRRKLSQVFNTALRIQPGPVHINVPLAEPLYQTAESALTEFPKLYNSAKVTNHIDKDLLEYCAEVLNGAEKVMILAGQMAPDHRLNELLESFAERPNTVVLTETSSNVYGDGIISTIDRLIMSVQSPKMLEAMMPDLLITIGGMVVSKKIKALLRGHKPKEHWHIHQHDKGLDTYKNLSQELRCNPVYFLNEMNQRARVIGHSEYNKGWKELNELGKTGHIAYLKTIEFSDFKAFELLHNHLPENIVLHMANSSPVRYVQLFGSRKNTIYHSNRGTSGIDGCTSTAAGWAKADSAHQHVLVTGDVAFLYDSNALWNRHFPKNLKIIVINNQGGGIFRIIEGAEHVDELETFFEAHHEVDIRPLAAAYGIAWFGAENEIELANALNAWNEINGPALLEIKTPGKKNAPVLKGYFRHIRAVFQSDQTVRTVD
jgi:2-succinyl-5-enolpyruvyl-6-hydroxy-3-cyclohexene-1-carboxylate synthase